MIIIMKATATTTDITDLKDRLESRGLRAVVMQGQEKTAVGVIGETRLHLPADQILALPSVESIRRVATPASSPTASSIRRTRSSKRAAPRWAAATSP